MAGRYARAALHDRSLRITHHRQPFLAQLRGTLEVAISLQVVLEEARPGTRNVATHRVQRLTVAAPPLGRPGIDHADTRGLRAFLGEGGLK